MIIRSFTKPDGKILLIEINEIVAVEEFHGYCVIETILNDYHVIDSIDEIIVLLGNLKDNNIITFSKN